MEFLFSQLKKMDVVCISDGKNLGKVCDLAFYFPENQLKGLFVTGCKGFKFSKSDVFIPMRDVVKIGEDVILVKLGQEKPPKNPPPDKCPPQLNCPPPNNCRPNCPPPNNRRNFDDYE
ncbi:MAG: PRC-barrel domain-containing protein [Clostridia bacterium]|nr:PRC-barrel domain-containing protein [Clostridia bacterium]